MTRGSCEAQPAAAVLQSLPVATPLRPAPPGHFLCSFDWEETPGLTRDSAVSTSGQLTPHSSPPLSSGSIVNTLTLHRYRYSINQKVDPSLPHKEKFNKSGLPSPSKTPIVAETGNNSLLISVSSPLYNQLEWKALQNWPIFATSSSSALRRGAASEMRGEFFWARLDLAETNQQTPGRTD